MEISFEIKKVKKYSYDINYYAALNNIDKELIVSIISVESSFIENATSSAGAVGLMQILPSTARYITKSNNYPYDDASLYDPNYNISIGTLYLKYLFSKFSDLKLVLIAYNAGEGNLALWLEKGVIDVNKVNTNDVPFKETKNYVRKVIKKLQFYNKISPLLFDKS